MKFKITFIEACLHVEVNPYLRLSRHLRRLDKHQLKCYIKRDFFNNCNNIINFTSI